MTRSVVVKDLYIFISEGELLVKKDIDYIINKKILTLDDIESDETLLVCISRDYFDIPNPIPSVVMVRDQLSNVFCPKWRTNSVFYSTLHSIMNLPGDLIPNIYFMTNNEDIYNNIDYYVHLSNFEKRHKMLIPNDDDNDEELTFVPIKSEIRRTDIKDLGILSVKVLEFAGYHKDENKKVPGWIFQCANPWLTRVLDLYEIYPSNNLLPKSATNLILSKKELINSILNPIPLVSHKISEDIRISIVESFEVRKELYKYSKDLLSRIGVR